jgi:hypothetical protein
MKTLSKESRDYILQLISERNLKSILSFCVGYGIDTNNYSSAVHYSNGKLTIKYRRENKYYYL